MATVPNILSEHDNALKRGKAVEQRRFEQMFICIQAMLHGLKKEEPDKEGENDSKQAGKERAKHLHDRYHRFLKGELLELLTEKRTGEQGNAGAQQRGEEESPKRKVTRRGSGN